MDVFFSAVIAYLLGSVSFSYLTARVLLNDDIRKHGSGNAGATNTLRVLGVVPAVIVLLLDVFKGVAAVWIADGLGGGEWVLPLSGLMAIVGHNWPIFFQFRGGKGVATTIGVFATLFFLPSLYAGIAAILFIAATRYVSLGSLIFVAAAPVLTLFVGNHPLSYFYAGLVIAALSYWRHRANIMRLLAGTENQLGRGERS
ncbi:MAG TPA: glycerol-3-phosphate 1-O-acyltransferase PlsY [Bacillales bacterium]|nr:glycerol-3-phosphate 1-O-acyltransferase PlsY [Bacillales bacterium]